MQGPSTLTVLMTVRTAMEHVSVEFCALIVHGWLNDGGRGAGCCYVGGEG